MFSYCTCSTRRNKRDVNEGRSPFREVAVDKEGICLNCGYYAVISRNRIAGNGKLYSVVCSKGEEVPPKRFDGGLSLRSQRLHKKLALKKRDESDQEGKDSDGCMDV